MNGSGVPGLPEGMDCLAGGGEMGSLMRSLDWSSSPLGPVKEWPQSLRTAVSMMLNSGYPLLVCWGPRLIKLYNDAYRSVLGAKHPQALGRPVEEVWPEIWPTIGPMLHDVMESGEPIFSEDMPLFMDRNGYLEEMYITFSYGPIRDESGGVGGILVACNESTQTILGQRRLGTLHDVAGRTAEAKTTEEAARLVSQAISENPRDVPFALLYLLEDDRRSARLVATTGCEPGSPLCPETLSRSAEQRWPLDQALDTRQVQEVSGFASLWSEKGPWPEPPHTALVLPLSEPGHPGPAGILVAGVNPRRALDVSYRAFFDSLAAQTGMALANSRSYEEERRRVKVLAELDRAKTVFFSDISHEFRTPLTLMLGPIQELLSGTHEELSPDDRDQLSLVHRNGLRLLKLVNTLLDFSRIEAGRMQALYEPTDLAGFTGELVSVFRSAIEHVGMRLTMDSDAIPEPVYVDRNMWEKIVFNLLSNAFKFTFEGEIAVSLRAHDGKAELSVRDTGTGIPEEEIPRLFERFHRVQGARGRTSEGTGIGLALVQELVKLHGGSLDVESVLGKGSTFRVTLPLGYSHLPADSVEKSSSPAPPATIQHAEAYLEEANRWAQAKLGPDAALGVDLIESPGEESSLPIPRAPRSRILLVDDNADMRAYVSRLLGQRYQVEAAADGLAALEAVRRRLPDLVLADVMLPGLDGFGLLQTLRTDPSTNTIPVILLSARAGDESRVEGLEAGADDYLVKPFSARELMARVAAHLEMTRLRHEAALREQALRADAETARESVTTILESITDGFVAIDRDWRYTYVNHEAETILQKKREQLLGKRMWDEYPEALGTLLERELRRAASERVPVELENYFGPSGRWFGVTTFPSKDGGLSIYFRDVTNRKRVEKSLAEQNAAAEFERGRLHAILDILPVGVFITDANGSLVEANRAARTLWGDALVLGPGGFRAYKGWWPTTGERIEAHEWALARAMREGTVVADEEIEIECFDGARKNILNYALPIQDASGEILGGVAVNVDITPLKAAQQELEVFNETLEQRVADRTAVAEKRLAQLRALASELSEVEQHERRRLAQILHDHIQQLLVAAKIAVDLVPSRIDDRALQQSIEEVRQLLNQSIDASRSLAVELSPPVLYEVGLAAALKWLGEIKNKKYGLKVEVEADRSAEPTDEDVRVLLFQAVRELLFNVIKHARADQARVTMAREDNRVSVSVEDDGAGFDVSSLDSQGPAPEGFGLFSIRERIEVLGGKLQIESVHGRGTRVKLTAPLSLEAEPSAVSSVRKRRVASTAAPVAPRRAARASKIQVLLADDHKILREGLARLLQEQPDVEVIGEAADGLEALDMARNLQPDVVVMDVTMPRLNGIEATRRLAAELPQIRVVGLSMHQEEMAAAMFEAGAAAFLPKDCISDSLLAAIRDASSTSPARPSPPPK